MEHLFLVDFRGDLMLKSCLLCILLGVCQFWCWNCHFTSKPNLNKPIFAVAATACFLLWKQHFLPNPKFSAKNQPPPPQKLNNHLTRIKLTTFLAPTGKLYEWLCHRGRRERDRDRWWAKITFWLVVRIRQAWFGQKLAQPSNLTQKTSLYRRFWNFSKLTSRGEVKGQNLTKFRSEITFWVVVQIR